MYTILLHCHNKMSLWTVEFSTLALPWNTLLLGDGWNGECFAWEKCNNEHSSM